MSEFWSERLRGVRARVVGTAVQVAAVTALWGCGGAGEGAVHAGAPVVVEAAVARRDSVSVDVSAVGSVQARATVEVKSEIKGTVAEIRFQEGAAVSRGQVLLRLDDAKLGASLAAAEAAEARARAEAENLAVRLGRNDRLLALGAISEQAYDDLKTRQNTAAARLREAEANVRLARQRLADATLRAPFDGRIGERHVDVGDFVTDVTPLFTIVDDRVVEVAFSVPEKYVGRLHEGSEVRLKVRSLPNQTLVGPVTFVSPMVEPGSRTVKMKASIPNERGELRAGQFAEVRLRLALHPDAITAPEAAVVPQGGQNFVFVSRGGTAQRRVVSLGERYAGRVEVLSGLAAGDTVVVAGQQKIADGSALSPVMLPEQGPVGDAAAADAAGTPAAVGG